MGLWTLHNEKVISLLNGLTYLNISPKSYIEIESSAIGKCWSVLSDILHLSCYSLKRTCTLHCLQYIHSTYHCLKRKKCIDISINNKASITSNVFISTVLAIFKIKQLSIMLIHITMEYTEFTNSSTLSVYWNVLFTITKQKRVNIFINLAC